MWGDGRLTNYLVVIILQQIHVSNRHVYLKLAHAVDDSSTKPGGRRPETRASSHIKSRRLIKTTQQLQTCTRRPTEPRNESIKTRRNSYDIRAPRYPLWIQWAKPDRRSVRDRRAWTLLTERASRTYTQYSPRLRNIHPPPVHAEHSSRHITR